MAGFFLCVAAHSQTCEELFISETPTTLGYYDSHAAEYNSTRAHVSPELAKQRDAFVAMLPKGARILEIGAGHGRDALYFQSLGFEVVATEPSIELAKLATEKLGRPVLNTRAQDIRYDQEFDAVWASASLIHVPPSELPLVFEVLKRAVKHGGIIHASFLKGVGTEDVPEQIPDGRYFNRASEKLLRKVVKDVRGLKVIEELTRGQGDDYFLSSAPTSTFGFFNLYLKRDPAIVGYAAERAELTIGEHKVTANVISAKDHWNYYRADKILPEYDRNRRVIIGLNGVHTYLYYRGYMLDSYGTLGTKITSRLRKTELLYGDLLLVMHDLPEEILINLDREFQRFVSRGRATCVRHTCATLNQMNSQWLNGTDYYRFSSLIEKLIELKTAQKIDLEVVALGADVETRYQDSRRAETDFGYVLRVWIDALKQRFANRP